MYEKVALKHSSKSTKYELEGSYDDLVHELSWTYHTASFLGLQGVVLSILGCYPEQNYMLNTMGIVKKLVNNVEH